MRVTQLTMTENTIRGLAENQERISSLQQKIASTKQFQVVSDDPGAASAALSLRSSLRLSKTYQDIAETTNSWLTASENAFASMVKLASDATDLVTSAINDTNGSEERAAMATQLGLIFEEAISLGNTKFLGNYIFSGYHITTQPFRVENGAITYDGDNGIMQREIAPGQTVTTNVIGDAAFSDFFNTLLRAQTAVNSGVTDDMSQALDDLNSALDTIAQYRANNGAVQARVKNTIDQSGTAQTEIKALLSQKEDLDVLEAVSILDSQQTTYEVALEVAQRAIDATNLFALLR